MAHNHTVLDPDGAIEIPMSLADGLPMPIHVLAEAQAMEGDEDVVIATPGANIRLRTTYSDSSHYEEDTSVLLPLSERPIPTQYPGLNLNPL